MRKSLPILSSAPAPLAQADDTTPHPPFRAILVKLAMRCNIDCSYCYWFRDADVYRKPSLLTPAAEAAFLSQLESHIVDFSLKEFRVIFHGGEPLLFGKTRFAAFARAIRQVEARTRAQIDLAVTTNAVLVDAEWAALLQEHQVSVSVSLDGPKEINDRHRKDHTGAGTYDRVIRGLTALREQGIEPGILAVCEPSMDPAIVLSHFVDDLHLTGFDILIPDVTHDDAAASIAPYYTRLFDLWMTRYARRGIRVRLLQELVKGVLGGQTSIESIGYGPIQTLVMLTDGGLEPLDVLRIAGDGSTATGLSVLHDSLQEVTRSPVWLEAYHASLALPEPCRQCEYEQACGGGYLPHRWSSQRRFDNPSVYCDDYKQIFGHIWDRVASQIIVNAGGERLTLREAAASVQQR